MKTHSFYDYFLTLKLILLLFVRLFSLKIIPAVRDQDEMGTQLLIIAGQRIKQFIIQSHQFRETTSNLSPAVTSWLASLVRI